MPPPPASLHSAPPPSGMWGAAPPQPPMGQHHPGGHVGGHPSFQPALAGAAGPQANDPWAAAPAGDGGDFLSMLAQQTANWHGQRR